MFSQLLMEIAIGADFSRIVADDPVDSRLRVRATSGQSWPWLCGDPVSYSRRAAVDTASSSAFEIAPVLPNDHAPTVCPWRNSSTLTRGVRAFTTFFIQQLDDHQLLPSFTTRSVSPVETAQSHPSSNLPNISSSIPSSHDDSQRIVYTNNYMTSMTNKTDKITESQFCDQHSGAWQQVCHTAITLYDKVKTLSTPYDAIDSRHLPNSSTHALNLPPSDAYQGQAQPKAPLPNDESGPTVASYSPKAIPPANAAAVLSGDSQDAGTGRNPKQVRGSCMAIVIGLVVGIMWF